MMSIQLTNKPVERGSAEFVIKFYDTRKKLVEPNDDITWSLYRPDGEIVNSRENIDVTPPAEEISIVLMGDDLPNGELILLVECTFNSDLGSNLPLRKEREFRVERTTK